jgi:hypothetical protein
MVAFDSADEAVLSVIASLVGSASQTERIREQQAERYADSAATEDPP